MKIFSLLSIAAIACGIQAHADHQETALVSDSMRLSCSRPSSYNKKGRGRLNIYLGLPYGKSKDEVDYIKELLDQAGGQRYSSRTEYTNIVTTRGRQLPHDDSTNTSQFALAAKATGAELTRVLAGARRLAREVTASGFSNFDDESNRRYRETDGPAVESNFATAARSEAYDTVGLASGLIVHYDAADKVIGATELPMYSPPLPCERLNEDMDKTVTYTVSE